MIASALTLAQGLSKSSAQSETQVEALSHQIEGARRAFASAAAMYDAPESVLSELDAALEYARVARDALKAGSDDTARTREEWAAARLKRAVDRVRRRWRRVLFLVVLFVGLIIFLAFYLNALLDRREEKRLRTDSEKRHGPLWAQVAKRLKIRQFYGSSARIFALKKVLLTNKVRPCLILLSSPVLTGNDLWEFDDCIR
jgi:hypothetical protein